MRDVVIDTGAASLLQRRQAPPWILRHLAGARIWLTFITVGEMADWAVRRRWDETRRGRLDAWTAGRPVIPFDTRIARLWGELAGQAQLRGRPRPQNHAWIAACCLRYQLPLLALHPADFCDFGRFHGLTLLGDRALTPDRDTAAGPGQDGRGDQGQGDRGQGDPGNKARPGFVRSG